MDMRGQHTIIVKYDDVSALNHEWALNDVGISQISREKGPPKLLLRGWGTSPYFPGK